MYSIEELTKKWGESTDNVKRFFILSQILTNNWIEFIRSDKLEPISDEEYFERLIFSSFFIFKTGSFKDEYEQQIFMSKILLELMLFTTKFGHFEEKIGGCYTEKMTKFIIARYGIIEREIKEMEKDNNYTTPFLIYNLYINPTNVDDPTFIDILDEIGGDELLKQSLLFRTSYVPFVKMLQDTINLLNELE